MNTEEILRAGTTPLSAPAFPPGSHRFTDREYLNVVYRTDPAAFRAALPEPLEVVEPLVRFEVMRMGDVDGFGPYTECGQALTCAFGGEQGEYLHAMYLDNAPATFAGREQSAYPKAFGSPRLWVEQGTLVGALHVGSLPVATATMAYKNAPLDPDEARAQVGVPTFAVTLTASTPVIAVQPLAKVRRRSQTESASVARGAAGGGTTGAGLPPAASVAQTPQASAPPREAMNRYVGTASTAPVSFVPRRFTSVSPARMSRQSGSV